MVAGLAPLALAGSAWAADDFLAAAEQEAAAFSLETAIVGTMFGIIILLLAIVTAGVAYINLKQFLDNRQEEEDRKGKARNTQPAASSSAAASKEEEESIASSLKRGSRQKKEKGKGFGDFTTRT